MKQLKRTIAIILTLSIMMSWENLQVAAEETDVVNYQEAACHTETIFCNA